MSDINAIFDAIVIDFRAAQSDAQAFSQRQHVQAKFIVNTMRERIEAICDVANRKLSGIGYALTVASSFKDDDGSGSFCDVYLVRGGPFGQRPIAKLRISLQRDGRITTETDRGEISTFEITPELTSEDTADLVGEFVRAALPMPFSPS